MFQPCIFSIYSNSFGVICCLLNFLRLEFNATVFSIHMIVLSALHVFSYAPGCLLVFPPFGFTADCSSPVREFKRFESGILMHFAVILKSSLGPMISWCECCQVCFGSYLRGPVYRVLWTESFNHQRCPPPFLVSVDQFQNS